MAEFPTYKEMGKKIAEEALDVFAYQGKTIREWVKIITEQEPCEDTISRQAAIDAIWDGINMDIYTREVKECLEALPSVTPQQKTGHWISHYDEDIKEGWYECDRCHTERAFNTKFCPDCGCCMFEPQKRENKG